jgi:hypothetical protein
VRLVGGAEGGGAAGLHLDPAARWRPR